MIICRYYTFLEAFSLEYLLSSLSHTTATFLSPSCGMRINSICFVFLIFWFIITFTSFKSHIFSHILMFESELSITTQNYKVLIALILIKVKV